MLIKNLQEYHDIIDICENEVLLIIIKNDIYDSLKMN